ncbi:MAG: hypothetical protein J6R43_00520 [Paludibacteraceae bacterium]|nr:hypothetical protein [Paludibacteraceae bacterium]
MKTSLSSKILLSLLLIAVSVLPLKAQKGDPNLDSQNRHYVTISVAGGATGFAMMPSYGSILSPDANFDDNKDNLAGGTPVVLRPEDLKITPFLGGTFGIGYEYQGARGFWISVGLEGQLYSGALHHEDSIRRLDHVMDGNVETGVAPADIEYTVINWNERQTVASANLPIMLGYKAASGFYGGIGAKVGFSLYNKIKGDYGFAHCNLFYEDMLGAEDIFKGVLDLTEVQSMDSNFLSRPRAVPMLEFGWQNLELEINKRSKMRFKFALVGECDVLSAYRNISSAESLFDYNQLEGFRVEDLKDAFSSVNSFYSTIPLGMTQAEFNNLKGQGKFINYTKPSALHAWFVGVKVAVMFEMPHSKWCNCWNNNVRRPWHKKFKDRGVE